MRNLEVKFKGKKKKNFDFDYGQEKRSFKDSFQGSSKLISIMVIIAAVILSVVEPGLIPVWLGLVIAIVAFIVSRQNEKGYRVGSYYFMGIGILMALLGLIFYIKAMTQTEGEALLVASMVLFPFVFVTVGGYIAIVVPLERKYRKLRCTQTVDSLIINFKTYTSTDEDGHTSESYAPIFQYEYNLQMYTTLSSAKANRPPIIGTRQKIFLNPNKPTEIFDPNLEDKSQVFLIIFGLIFATGGFGFLFQILIGML